MFRFRALWCRVQWEEGVGASVFSLAWQARAQGELAGRGRVLGSFVGRTAL